ncbi:hypothetical protein JOM56_001748 [Amanita muscaria]
MKNLFASVTERFPQPDYLRSFLWVLEFTISCPFLGIPYFFIGRSRGQIVDEEDGSRSVAPCLRHAGISWHLASWVLLFYSFVGLGQFLPYCRLCGGHTCGPLDVIKLSCNQVWSGEITSRRRWRRASTLETKRGRVSILRIIGFVTGIMLHTLEGASVMNAGLVRQPFDKYTHWTATGALGAVNSSTSRITTECFLLLVRRKTLPSDPRQFWTFLTTKSVHIRCPCPVRLEAHVTEGSELVATSFVVPKLGVKKALHQC